MATARPRLPNYVVIFPTCTIASDFKLETVNGHTPAIIISKAEYDCLEKNAKMTGHYHEAGSSDSGASDLYHSSPPFPRGFGHAGEAGCGSPLDTSPFRPDEEATLPELKCNRREMPPTFEEVFVNLNIKESMPSPSFGHGLSCSPVPFLLARGSANDPRAFNVLRQDSTVDDNRVAIPSAFPQYNPCQPWGPPRQHGSIRGQHNTPAGATHSRDAHRNTNPGQRLVLTKNGLDRMHEEQNRLPAAGQVFHPMHAAATGQHPEPTLSARGPLWPAANVAPPAPRVDPMEKVLLGFSPNYMGNVRVEKNRSANIPADENCSLWLTGLPPGVTYGQVLSAVRGVGRVYQTHINRPEPDRGHLTSACKLVFFDRPSAQRFWDRHSSSSSPSTGFVIPEYPAFVARVAWNRVRAAAVEGPGARALSRVLLVSGPAQLVNGDFLTRYFRSKMEFNVECVIVHHPGGGGGGGGGGGEGEGEGEGEAKDGRCRRATVEYRFASFRCQAESAKMAISRELRDHDVQVWFWKDPCDVAVGGEERDRDLGRDSGWLQGGEDAGVPGRHPAHVAKDWRAHD